jgi:pilus assembly protein Flp/PilA
MFEVGVKNFISSIRSDESGATAIEYALIAAGVAVAIIGGVAAVGGSVQSLFTAISALL